MGRLLIYNPEINKNTVLHFNFTKGGSWKIRDYSSGKEKVIKSSKNSHLSVEAIMRAVKWQDDAESRRSVKEHDYWKNEIDKCNNEINKLIEKELLNNEVEPFDFAINKCLKELIEKAERIPPSTETKLNPLNIINDVFEVEEISKVNPADAIGSADAILNKIVADLCEQKGVSCSSKFYENLNSLKRNNILSKKAFRYYSFIRDLRNIAVHVDRDNISLDDVRIVRFMLSNIINWYLESLY
jgi:hypothetical protein